MVALLVLVAAHTAHVELSSKTAAQSMTDTRLGQVLADQLRIAPSVVTLEEAAAVHALTGTTMLNKPKAVMLAVLDGPAGQGAELESACEHRRECVGTVCYNTRAACVLHKLVSQTDDASTLGERVHVQAVASHAHLAAAAGHQAVQMVGADPVHGLGVMHLGGAPRPQLDLAQAVMHAHQIEHFTDGLKVDGNSLHMQIGDKKVVLDGGNPCVRLVLGEALALHGLTAGSDLYVAAPRGGACMKAAFGPSATETHVAHRFLERAVGRTADRLGAWTAKVHLETQDKAQPAKEMSEAVLAPSLVMQARRLSAVSEASSINNKVADYHIFTWSTIAIFLSLYAAVYAITGMTSDRDPLLYAKFRPEVDPTARR